MINMDSRKPSTIIPKEGKSGDTNIKKCKYREWLLKKLLESLGYEVLWNKNFGTGVDAIAIKKGIISWVIESTNYGSKEEYMQDRTFNRYVNSLNWFKTLDEGHVKRQLVVSYEENLSCCEYKEGLAENLTHIFERKKRLRDNDIDLWVTYGQDWEEGDERQKLTNKGFKKFDQTQKRRVDKIASGYEKAEYAVLTKYMFNDGVDLIVIEKDTGSIAEVITVTNWKVDGYRNLPEERVDGYIESMDWFDRFPNVKKTLYVSSSNNLTSEEINRLKEHDVNIINVGYQD